MSDTQSTYDISAPSIRPYVQEIRAGALAMAFNGHDEEGRKIGLADDHISGKHLLLIFLGEPEADYTNAVLHSLSVLEARLDAANATVIAVSASSDASANKTRKRVAGFTWPVVGDSSGAIFATYGLHKGSDKVARLVLLTPFRQVRTWFDLEGDAGETLETIMTMLDNAQAATETRWSPPHAPVLVVPNVLSPEECANLIESVEKDTPFLVRRARPGEFEGNFRIPVYEHERQDRVDLIIRDRNTQAILDERLFGRVTPMINKAFAFNVTRREDLHIARYVGKRQGIAMGHRDNTSPVGAHRRFALSISLNDDYEGGGIVFGEFSPKGYRVPAGSAMVFSSSLLHEVQETTSGVRYNLISHLFNDG